MKQIFILLLSILIPVLMTGQSTTPVPNNSFEDWINYGNYEDPAGWDTPNFEISSIPLFGTTVVTKSTEHHGAGMYSVKLESKHIVLPPLDIPGFITCGQFTLDIASMTYTMTGGAPVNDQPTHLKGFYKYFPKGGDSCVMAIGLFITNDTIRDTVAGGFFSTKDTVPDWALFSAWIDYDTILQPDSMNIFAFSTAQDVVTPGTVLYLDELFLDYTVGFDEKDPGAGINVYNDRETNRLIIFFDFPDEREVSLHLFNMMGQQVVYEPSSSTKKDRKIMGYQNLEKGVYILEILQPGKKFIRKFYLN